MQTDRVYNCIFCQKHNSGNNKLTSEHILPRWLKKYFPYREAKTYHWTSLQGSKPDRGKLDRPGDFYSSALRVVCRECNSGWMSKLTEEAKPILLPLLRDGIWRLNESDQRILALWAASVTMVAEYSDIKTAAVPQSHRTLLQSERMLNSDWRVWIGRQEIGDYHPGYRNHFGGFFVSMNPNDGSRSIHRYQFTGFTVEHLLVQTAMLTPPVPSGPFSRFDEEGFASGYDLRTIFPFSNNITCKPFIAHDYDSRQLISSDPAHAMGLKVYINGPVQK